MKVSIFTPTHNGKFLNEVYESIKHQDFDEWVILHNNGSKKLGLSDPRVNEVVIDIPIGNKVGLCKKLACGHCTGDILVELDHDDLLTPDAITLIRAAFEDESIGFVFSNALYTNLEYGKLPRFDAEYGWQYRETEFNGHILDEPLSFPITPASVSRIWFAPDHVRAFRRSEYDKVGGYDVTLEILDDQDLMCKLYKVTTFKHIDKALYVYRVHGDNAWLEKNQKIQDGVYPLYDKHIEDLILKWATDNNLLKLDLGGRLNKQVRYKSVDICDADICCNLDHRWPFKNNSVGVVRAFDVFEHLKNPVQVMEELYRVLVPGGYALLQVPSTDGRGAFQDPTHVSYWNENSFLYYTNKIWAQYIGAPVRFQALRLYTTGKDALGVCWVVTHLIKLDDSVRVPGRIFI